MCVQLDACCHTIVTNILCCILEHHLHFIFGISPLKNELLGKIFYTFLGCRVAYESARKAIPGDKMKILAAN